VSEFEGLAPEQIDTSRPHPARMYDYYLGGKDNYEVDRRAAERVIELEPNVLGATRANRAFLRRATAAVTRRGIRQIIDVGTGIPTSPNTHEVARAVDPDVRVAYVDNDPIVGVYAGARLTNHANTGFALADLRDPEAVLGHPVVRELIDLGEPVALLLVAVLHFVRDDEDPAGLVAALARDLAPGSCLVVSQATADFYEGDNLDAVYDVYRGATATLNLRGHAEVLPFFDGFDLLDPGVVPLLGWRPDGPALSPAEERHIGCYVGVGVKR
jgi:SAM-dependent methyltransferase